MALAGIGEIREGMYVLKVSPKWLHHWQISLCLCHSFYNFFSFKLLVK